MRRMRVVLVGFVVAGVLAGAGCTSGGSDTSTEGGKDGAATSPEPVASTSTEATTSTASPIPPLDDQTPPESINGLAVHGNTLFVASIKGDEVLQVDRESGAILRRFDTGGAGPDDVAVAPDGSVWTTGFVNGDLGRIAEGSYEVVTTMEAGINPLEFGSDGTLYIGTYGPGGTLYALSTNRGEPIEGEEPQVVAEDLPDSNAFGVLANDTLVAPAGGLTGPSEAVLIDPAEGTVSTIVGDLPAVAAGAIDADGTPYVLANITGEVIAVDVEATTSEVVRTVKEGSPFDNLAFAPDGTLYVSSFTAPAITVVAPDGSERVLSIGS
jgi:streptogramin lyase